MYATDCVLAHRRLHKAPLVNEATPFVKTLHKSNNDLLQLEASQLRQPIRWQWRAITALACRALP